MGTKTRFSATFVLIPKVVSGLGIFLSGLVLLGWMFDLPILQSILPGQPQMVPLTAISFVLTSLSLGSLKRFQNFSALCAVAVILIAVLTISEYVSGLDLGFDRLLFTQRLQISGKSFPGRPSPHTAIDLLLIGSALL